MLAPLKFFIVRSLFHPKEGGVRDKLVGPVGI